MRPEEGGSDTVVTPAGQVEPAEGAPVASSAIPSDETDWPKVIAARIAEMRATKRTSQLAVAKRVGKSRSWQATLESGISLPSEKNIRLFAKSVGQDPEPILTLLRDAWWDEHKDLSPQKIRRLPENIAKYITERKGEARARTIIARDQEPAIGEAFSLPGKDVVDELVSDPSEHKASKVAPAVTATTGSRHRWKKWSSRFGEDVAVLVVLALVVLLGIWIYNSSQITEGRTPGDADQGRCAQNTGVVDRVKVYMPTDREIGTLELATSGDCATSWGRFVGNSQLPTNEGVLALIHTERPADKRVESYSQNYHGQPVEGKMLHDNDSCVQATVQIVWNAQTSSVFRTGCHQIS